MSKKSKRLKQFKSRIEQHHLNLVFDSVKNGTSVPQLNKNIKRGDVYYIFENPDCVGHEMEKGRPGVVISTNDINSKLFTVTIVYLTTKPKIDNNYHTVIRATGKSSTVLAEHITNVDATRIGDYCGTVSFEEMERIEECVMNALCLQNVSKHAPVPATTSVDIPTPSSNSCSEEELQSIRNAYEAEIATLKMQLTAKETERQILSTMYENLLSKVLTK